MKTIIALKGIGNSGKSMSIKRAYTILKYKYSDVGILYEKVMVDVKAIITIKNKIIGVESQGDPTSRLTESLEEFSRKGCNIILCATRTYGGTVEAVKNMESEYQIQWILKNKSEESLISVDNENMANMLV